VLDGDLNPLPVGVPGQLYLGGPGLARGYLGDDALTAAKFVAHPFAPGERLYATGDIVAYRPDGNLDFITRNDHQLKIRGFRIEPGEVEAALRRQPGIRDAFVRATTSDDGDRQLLAYVVDDVRPARVPEHWRNVLAAELPVYLVPSGIVCVPELPLSRNGKIDVAALPEWRPARSDGPAIRMNNPLHHQLGVIWESLLSVSNIGIHDNFFEIGGHSLLAARLMIVVENETGKAVPLARFFEDPTIGHLAKLLVQSLDLQSGSPVTALNPNGSRPPLFFVHSDLNGGGYYTRKFARRLDAEQPFYVLAPHGSDGRACPATITEMARDFVRAIRVVRPDGPYVLGGFCSGGLIALEMAAALREQGAEVTDVILLDVPSTNARLSGVASFLDACARALRLRDSVRIALGEKLGLAATWVRRTTARLRRNVRLARRAGGMRAISHRLIAGRARRDYLEPEFPWLEPFWRKVTASHIPRRYDGPITLLVSEQFGLIGDSRIVRRWRTVSPQLHVHPIKGQHLTCITRFADETAARLAEVLAVEDAAEIPVDV
ncbi:MAG: AMP-binding protein, partial [Candidatus Eremiobacteraeota bacterium]|nr:AMP-binding protein [Candidatus Eremiobacteraeota bacterium]